MFIGKSIHFFPHRFFKEGKSLGDGAADYDGFWIHCKHNDHHSIAEMGAELLEDFYGSLIALLCPGIDLVSSDSVFTHKKLPAAVVLQDGFFIGDDTKLTRAAVGATVKPVVNDNARTHSSADG
ncbi:hypothetical protein ES703_125320 [subsurface metagenome]